MVGGWYLGARLIRTGKREAGRRYALAGGGAGRAAGSTALGWGRIGRYGTYGEFHDGRALALMDVKLGYVLVGAGRSASAPRPASSARAHARLAPGARTLMMGRLRALRRLGRDRGAAGCGPVTYINAGHAQGERRRRGGAGGAGRQVRAVLVHAGGRVPAQGARGGGAGRLPGRQPARAQGVAGGAQGGRAVAIARGAPTAVAGHEAAGDARGRDGVARCCAGGRLRGQPAAPRDPRRSSELIRAARAQRRA